MTKYLWLVTQNEVTAWNTYHSVVVVAETESEARCVLPTSKTLSGPLVTWCSPEFVQVKYLGIAEPGLEGVICISHGKENEQ